MMRLRALIFDVDGTLAETEEVHRQAFNTAFAEAGLGWQWDRTAYRRLLKTTGGRERIARYASEMGMPDLDAQALHRRKTQVYEAMMANGSPVLRPGVANLLARARQQGIRLAIATTTSRPNVDILLAMTLGPEAISWFDAICCGGDVARKKPDGEVYRLALDRLGLHARSCIAFEDSEIGLKAAASCGLPVVVTPSLYTDGDDFSAADLVCSNLDNLPAALRHGNNVTGPILQLAGLTAERV